MTGAAHGSIFISYRREDCQHLAGRLRDRLIYEYDPSRVFFDVDSVEPGLDFIDAIERAVGDCDVLLTLIGTRWLTASDDRGRRIDDPDDTVASEIRAALARNVLVIPVLVDGASIPRRDELPESLMSLARRNAIRLDHESFSSDIGRLLDLLSKVVRQGDEVPLTVASTVTSKPTLGATSTTTERTTPPRSRRAEMPLNAYAHSGAKQIRPLLGRVRRILIWLGLVFSGTMLLGAVGATVTGDYPTIAGAIAGNLLFGFLFIGFIGWFVIDMRRSKKRKD